MYGKHHTPGTGPAPAMHGYPYYGNFPGGPRGSYFRRPKYNVPLNILDAGTAYEVHVYALGFHKDNITLSVVEDMLYISGTRTIDESSPPVFSRQEYPVKSFERVLTLNGQVDTQNIRARQEDGVLIITLPKTLEAQQPAQEIKID